MKKFTAGLILGTQIIFGQTLATVNGEKITKQDLLPTIAQLTQGRYDTLDQATKQRVEAIALEQAISQTLLEKEAVKKGILRDKEFASQLDLAIKHLKKQLISDMWLKKEFEKIKISSREVKAYYQSHLSEFVKPSRVRARHILVATESEARAIISTLSRYYGSKLKEKFSELAKEKSTGPSGKNGGDLGYFTEGQMVPNFNDAVFSMRVGTITKTPVKTQFGYHIIYLEDKEKKATASFEEAKKYIEQKIKVEKFKDFVQSKVDELKKKANIKIY